LVDEDPKEKGLLTVKGKRVQDEKKRKEKAVSSCRDGGNKKHYVTQASFFKQKGGKGLKKKNPNW
jgi:hypothetical protein